MKEREKILTEEQKNALRLIVGALTPDGRGCSIVIRKKLLEEAFGLSKEETRMVCAVLGLTFHYVSRNSGGEGINPSLKREFAGTLINNPPGSRELWEENHGVIHIPGGYFPVGRNHTGKVRVRRF